MSRRDWFEHEVVITNERKNAVLMAARKNVCSKVERLHMAAWTDHTWTEKGKTKIATTRILICKFHWKQNIGHLGSDVTVMGVHAFYRTIEHEFSRKR